MDLVPLARKEQSGPITLGLRTCVRNKVDLVALTRKDQYELANSACEDARTTLNSDNEFNIHLNIISNSTNLRHLKSL